MSVISQSLLSNSSCRVNFIFSSIKSSKFSSVSPPKFLPASSHFTASISRRYPYFGTYSDHGNSWSIKVYDTNGAILERNDRFSGFDFDDLLSLAELACLFSSVAVAVGFIVNWKFFKGQNVGAALVAVGSRVLVWLLTGAVVIGAVIRRRQWRRACGISVNSGEYSGNVVERIEKLEESLRSATTIIQVLSRQLEKLGIRFRVTRKYLKEPISETAALAQKNSEVTRALAAQEDNLEKELAGVQKVLLAMQDQQQKQLDLLLAIAKHGKLLESKRGPAQERKQKVTDDASDNRLRQVDGQQIRTSGHKSSSYNGLGG